MSLLTEATLIITPLGATLEMKAALEAPVNTDRGPQGFLPFDPDDAGGSKFYCSDVYAAMFNYVLAQDVVDFVAALPWGRRQGFLLINDEDETDTGVRWYAFPGARPMGILDGPRPRRQEWGLA